MSACRCRMCDAPHDSTLIRCQACGWPTAQRVPVRCSQEDRTDAALGCLVLGGALMFGLSVWLL